MELMIEYKDGKHLNWDPDAIIKDYHATFADPPTPPLENDLVHPPIEEENANGGNTAGGSDAADPPLA